MATRTSSRRYTRTASHGVFTVNSRSTTFGAVETVYVGIINGGNTNAGTIVKVKHGEWIAFAKGDIDAEQGPATAGGFKNRADAADAARRLSYDAATAR